MNATRSARSSKTSWAARCVVGTPAIALALYVGTKVLPTWAAYAVAVVVCLVLQEAIVLVFAEIKGREQEKEAV